MIGIVIVTHGKLAKEFIVALEHVVGEQKNIIDVCIFPEDDMEKRRSEILEAIDKVDCGKGVKRIKSSTRSNRIERIMQMR